jgi:5-methyltetrahydropteroyltriglutamate--homocysteine methyltransferase
VTRSCDVGSLPRRTGEAKSLEGVKQSGEDDCCDSTNLFEKEVARAFLDKLRAGIDVPAYPQFRDMSDMFLSIIDGFEKTAGGYLETGSFKVKRAKEILPEVAAIKRHAQEISAENGGPFELRVCVTGPYTLASFFPYRNSQTYTQLGRALSEVVKANVFAFRQGKVALVAMDEPLFGVVDDPSIERGTTGRESLLAAWELMMRAARGQNAETCIHLHRTSDELFWEVESLNIIESHVGDPLYSMKATKEWLEREDKLLKASVASADFDKLIREKLGARATGNAVADVWKKIANGEVDPKLFLENVDLMKKRLMGMQERFSAERVPWIGTECGLRGFPTYESAIECLRRVSAAA